MKSSQRLIHSKGEPLSEVRKTAQNPSISKTPLPQKQSVSESGKPIPYQRGWYSPVHVVHRMAQTPQHPGAIPKKKEVNNTTRNETNVSVSSPKQKNNIRQIFSKESPSKRNSDLTAQKCTTNNAGQTEREKSLERSNRSSQASSEKVGRNFYRQHKARRKSHQKLRISVKFDETVDTERPPSDVRLRSDSYEGRVACLHDPSIVEGQQQPVYNQDVESDHQRSSVDSKLEVEIINQSSERETSNKSIHCSTRQGNEQGFQDDTKTNDKISNSTVHCIRRNHNESQTHQRVLDSFNNSCISPEAEADDTFKNLPCNRGLTNQIFSSTPVANKVPLSSENTMSSLRNSHIGYENLSRSFTSFDRSNLMMPSSIDRHTSRHQSPDLPVPSSRVTEDVRGSTASGYHMTNRKKLQRPASTLQSELPDSQERNSTIFRPSLNRPSKYKESNSFRVSSYVPIAEQDTSSLENISGNSTRDNRNTSSSARCVPSSRNTTNLLSRYYPLTNNGLESETPNDSYSNRSPSSPRMVQNSRSLSSHTGRSIQPEGNQTDWLLNQQENRTDSPREEQSNRLLSRQTNRDNYISFRYRQIQRDRERVRQNLINSSMERSDSTSSVSPITSPRSMDDPLRERLPSLASSQRDERSLPLSAENGYDGILNVASRQEMSPSPVRGSPSLRYARNNVTNHLAVMASPLFAPLLFELPPAVMIQMLASARQELGDDFIQLLIENVVLSILTQQMHDLGLTANSERSNRPPPATKQMIDGLKKRVVTIEIKDKETKCAICHVEYELRETLTQLECSHFFHHTCISIWLKKTATCPVCRYQLQDGC